jgi:hypothetical protein
MGIVHCFSHLIMGSLDWPADIWLALFFKGVGNFRQPFVSTSAFQVTKLKGSTHQPTLS